MKKVKGLKLLTRKCSFCGKEVARKDVMRVPLSNVDGWGYLCRKCYNG